MPIPLYRQVCNFGYLKAYSPEAKSGVWCFDDFRYEEDLTGVVTVPFVIDQQSSVSGTPADFRIDGFQEMGNEGELMDPPEGFVEEWMAYAQIVFDQSKERILSFILQHSHLGEAAMIQESRRLQEKWHTDMINYANRYAPTNNAQRKTDETTDC